MKIFPANGNLYGDFQGTKHYTSESFLYIYNWIVKQIISRGFNKCTLQFKKDVLVKALKDVTSALATRVVQPILSNVLIESLDETTVKFHCTDLDLTIETKATGVVYTPGSITLPGKKLLEIVSKLPSDLVSFQVNKDTFETSVTCKRSKFSITGLPADDFPKLPRAVRVKVS